MLVCILILLHGFEQAVFQEAASVLCFLIISIISGRNADKYSLHSKLFFFFLFTLENGPSQSCLWFSECMMLVRPLNGVLIINWLSMSSFSYHRMLAMGREAHSSESSLWGRDPWAETGWALKCSTHSREPAGGRMWTRVSSESKGQQGSTLSPREVTWEPVESHHLVVSLWLRLSL